MLPDFGARHALLLQGPAGPFMRRFADELRDAGVRATKVNFHVGDALYFSGLDAVSYRGTREGWPRFLRTLIDARGVDAIFVFGDCRPLHRAAIEVARDLGVAVWVFEEGYLRPDWITLERDGVNGYSRLPRDPEHYLALDLPELEPPLPVGPPFGHSAWYSTLSALAFTHLNQGYPHYEHHRNLDAWHHTGLWVRDFFRKRWLRHREAPLLPRLSGPRSGRYFLVPLQVYCDYQLLHSPYDSVMEFVEEVLETFAVAADPADSVVVKHHPMDRAHIDYTDELRRMAERLGVADRVHYVHDLHLPTLLRHARGTIVINSTVGLSSLYHHTPVKVLGTAVYDLPGLTHRGTLAEFLRDPGTFDAALHRAFRRYLLHTNQINGSFYRRLPGHSAGIGARWFPRPPSR